MRWTNRCLWTKSTASSSSTKAENSTSCRHAVPRNRAWQAGGDGAGGHRGERAGGGSYPGRSVDGGFSDTENGVWEEWLHVWNIPQWPRVPRPELEKLSGLRARRIQLDLEGWCRDELCLRQTWLPSSGRSCPWRLGPSARTEFLSISF